MALGRPVLRGMVKPWAFLASGPARCAGHAPLASLSLSAEPKLSERFDPELLGGCVVVEGDGLAVDPAAWTDDQPYRPLGQDAQAVRLKAIPYYLWGNRQPGEMSVWLRR